MTYETYIADVTAKTLANIIIESNRPVRPDTMKALLDHLTAEDMIDDENTDLVWGFEVDRETLVFNGFNGQALEYTFEAVMTLNETKKGDSLETIEEEVLSDLGCEFFHMVFDGIDVYGFPSEKEGLAHIDSMEYEVDRYYD